MSALLNQCVFICVSEEKLWCDQCEGECLERPHTPRKRQARALHILLPCVPCFREDKPHTEPVERLVWVPVLVNAKAVASGSELRALKNARVARPKEVSAIDASILAKCAKLR